MLSKPAYKKVVSSVFYISPVIFRSHLCALLIYLSLGFVVEAQTSVRPQWGPKKERNVTDEMNRKQGTWKYYYPNGEIKVEVNYLNNLFDGLYKKYYLGEKVSEETNFMAGKRDGEYRRYFLSGEVAIEGSYNMGRKDGKWTTYYEGGQVKSVGDYKNGIKDGKWIFYNRKGAITGEVTYANGVDVNAAKPVAPQKPKANNYSPKGNTAVPKKAAPAAADTSKKGK